MLEFTTRIFLHDDKMEEENEIFVCLLCSSFYIQLVGNKVVCPSYNMISLGKDRDTHQCFLSLGKTKFVQFLH